MVDIVVVAAADLTDLVKRILGALGCDERNAGLIAEGLVEADLRGNRIQGTDHLYSIVNSLRAGRINGNARPHVVRENAATAQVDGDGAAGHVGGRYAADIAIAKVAAAGIAAVGLVRAGDTFMLAGYVDRIARAGYVGLAFTNSLYTNGNSLFVMVHPAGGIDPVLGTNPLAVAIPRRGADPLITDMATSGSAMGHIRLATYSGDPIPAGIAIDRDGASTTDALTALAGALTPLGGHKGFALAISVALLSGPMIGAEIGTALKAEALADHPPRLGHFFVAIDPAAFGPTEEFDARVRSYVEELKAGRRAAGVSEILLPGERSARQRRTSSSEGIRMLADTWQQLIGFADELEIDPTVVPEIRRSVDRHTRTEEA